MKKKCLFLIGVILSNLLSAQFYYISLNDIYSSDSMSAWVVGENGTIIHVIDGGLFWEDHSYNTDLSLNSVHFINEQKGFIVGESGLLLKTADAGYTWDTTDLGVSFKFEAVSFIDDQYGWISSQVNWGYGLFRTINGGEDWDFIDVEIYRPFFIDSLNGWGCSSLMGQVHICRTYNGGESWDTISSYPATNLPYFYFIDNARGFMTLPYIGNTTCYNTYDGGLSWTPNSQFIEDFFVRDIFFNDTINGWVCGYNYIYYSSNFFVSNEYFYRLFEVFNALSIHGVSNGWAVSVDIDNLHSTVWKLEGENYWIPIETIGIHEVKLNQLLSIYPNPATNKINIRYSISDTRYLILIYDLYGRKLDEIMVSAKQEQTSVDVSSYSNGVYVAVIKGDGEILRRKKFVVR